MLSLRQLRSLSPSCLMTIVRGWINDRDPICLMHPHGFWVVLLNRSEWDEWRFHYWPRGPRPTTGMPAMIHTHNKVVESRIVLGALNNIVYSLTHMEADGRPVYEVAYGGDKFAQKTSNVLKITDKRAKAIVKNKSILKQGDSYRVEPHTYHEAFVDEEVATATIVCMHSRVPGSAKVLGLASYPEEIVFRRCSRPASDLLRLM